MNHQKTKPKKLLSLLLALTMTLSLGLFQNTALANEWVTIDNLTYDLNSQKMVASIIECKDKNTSNIVIPDRIDHNGKSYAVTSISACFDDCKNLVEVTIPEGIKTLGDSTFINCSKLMKVTLPSSITSIGYSTFLGCEKLTEINIPNGVKQIEARAFEDCKSLTHLILPDSITSIGDRAFFGCEKLEELVLPDRVSKIQDHAFGKCKSLTQMTLPNGITTIKEDIFYACEKLEEITIPNSVINIEEGAFSFLPNLKDIHYTGTKGEWNNIEIGAFDNSGLNNVTIHCSDGIIMLSPQNLNGTTIGNLYFELNPDKMVARLGQYSDKTVTNIDIPDRIEHNGQSYAVISIPHTAFRNCKALTEITVPNGIKTIGSQAFEFCESLTKVNLPDSLTAIKWLTFRDCKKLTEIVIPRGVKEIQDSAFLGCSNLKKVTISSNDLIEIGSRAFRNCEKLAELRIADGVSIIGSQAFLGCKSLTKLTLPDSVTVIKDAAFMNCHNLTEIKFSKNLRKIENDVFAGVSKLKDIYYNGTKSEWEAIEIGDFYNDALQTATVHLADGTTIPGVTPGNPGTTPGTPGNPGTATPPSVTPPVPGTPGTPGNPSNPGTATPPSVTPYVPNEPDTPSVPSTSNTPNTSNKPSTPSTPNKPADKNNPKEPGKEHTTPQTLTAVKTALTEKLTKSENLAPTAFADTEKHWAKESIQFVNKLGILKGIKETEFAPNEAMTRAMFITALGRLGNVNEQDYAASSFGDVPADAYYRSFAEWAKTAGISSGTQMGSFAPNQPISREQIAAMIFRFVKYLGYELPAVQAKAAFADDAQISSWAKEAVIALQQAGILQGKGNQMFDPQGKASRAEIAALLQRLVQAIMK